MSGGTGGSDGSEGVGAPGGPGESMQRAVASARWWELAGHDPAALSSAWAVLRHALIAGAEVGATLAEARDDGLEACFGWYEGRGLLDGFFAGMTVGAGEGRPRVRAALKLWDQTLYVVDEGGGVVGSLELEGRSPEEATVWALDTAMNAIDEGVRGGSPAWEEAPGAMDAGVFGPVNQLAQAELIRLYANTSAMLDALRGSLPVEDWEPGPTVVRADLGEMSADFAALGRGGRSSVRLGLRPTLVTPGGERPACWFAVSTDGGDVAATLAVERVSSTEDPDEQRGALSAFLVSALTGAAS